MKGRPRSKIISSDQVLHQVNFRKRIREKEQQQLRPPMYDGENGGNDYNEEENEGYDEEDDQSEGVFVHGGGADGGENNVDAERPKLAEGFYEIEALRKTRIRKGVKQYLIKWRGWPESANTWEPFESFASCPDVIEAFESMNYGKRKRKRKHAVGSMSQSRKKQKQHQQDAPDAACPIPSVGTKVIEEPCPGPCVHDSNGTENNVGGAGDNGTANQSNEWEGKVNEINGTSSMDQENMADFAIHIQEDPVKPANGVSKVDGAEVRLASPQIAAANGVSKVDGAEVRRASPQIAAANGVSKVDGAEVHCASPRIAAANGVSKVDGTQARRASPRIGARRRKSCAVKRFKKESNSATKTDATEKTTAASDVIVQGDMRNNDVVADGLDYENILETPQSVPVITKIVKPVNYSISMLNDTEEVSVSFLVRRSDEEEIVVDNKYLKENNPILLINFYEQHLRYNSPSE